MRELGEPAMPWQAHALDVQYELDEEATELASSAAGILQPRLWYREFDLTVPRQSGKTTKAKARHIHRMRNSRRYGWSPRPLSFYMAQTATDAREKLVEEWMESLRESPFWIADPDRPGRPMPDSAIQQFIKSNGREAIKWLGGGRITVKPPSRTGGHGGTPDAVDLDEAFAHRDGEAEQGVRPGMITKVSPQISVVSTAGTKDSVYLWGKVDDLRARCSVPVPGSRVAGMEWSAPEDETDYANPAVWAACMPALGLTQPLEAVRSEFDAMKLDEFRRAYLNQWTSSVERLIPAASWELCLHPQSSIVGEMWLAVDAAPGATAGARTAAIAVGGYNEQGVSHAEVVRAEPGLAWVADAVKDFTDRWQRVRRVYVDPKGTVGSIVPDIELASAVKLEQISAETMAAACGRFHEDVLAGSFAHIGQASLDKAVDGAAKRTLLDAWAFARRTSSSDISPLVAVTLAHWATVTHPRREDRIV